MRLIIFLFAILLSCTKTDGTTEINIKQYTRSGFISSEKKDDFIKKLGPYYLYNKKADLDTFKSVLITKITLNIDQEQTIKGFPDTELSFSADEKFLAIGSYFGELILYSIPENKIIWKKEFPLSVLKKMSFSDDSKILFVGEQSPDGNIYAIDVASGETKWTYRTANDIETSVYNPNDPYSIYSLPGIFNLEFRNGSLQVAALHSWFKEGLPIKKSKIYSFDSMGKKLWAYPEKEVFPANIKYFAQNKNYLSFVIDEINEKKYKQIHENSVVLLNGKNGRFLDSKSINVLKPHFNSVYFWQSISMNKNNNINFAA